MGGIKRVVAAIFDFLQGIVVVLALLVMVYLFIISPQEIQGSSMEPNFHNGEYILTNKIEYKFRNPVRGDVVILKSPMNKDIDFIKRVIGLPGDTISVHDNAIWINGEKVSEPYLAPDTPIDGGSYLAEGQTITIPDGMYFVCGDNRAHSSDSREFGLIAKDDLIGVAFFRYFPFSQMGTITTPSYTLL